MSGVTGDGRVLVDVEGGLDRGRMEWMRDRVVHLRCGGFSYRVIAAGLGISLDYANHLGAPSFVAEDLRAASRDAKRRRVGVCEWCGGPTRYNGRPGAPVSRVCRACNPGAARMRSVAGTRGRTAEFLAFFSEPRRYSEFRDHFGISSGYASQFLNRGKRNGWLMPLSRGMWVRVP